MSTPVETMEALIDDLRALEAIYVPNTVEAASDEGWECADALISDIAEGYSSIAQDGDSQRVIPVKAVLSLLAEFEENLVREMVLDPFDILWGKLTGAVEAVKYIATHLDEIYTAIKEAVEAGNVVDFIVNYLLEIITLAAVKAMAKKAMKARDGMAKKMRGRAFPQSTGKRFWRKRVTR